MKQAHLELRRRLERRAAELNHEVRSYPTPIARCDEQLGELLERRARVLALLRRLEDRQTPRATCAPLAAWLNDGGLHGA
jgi:hypothetical protein